MKILNTKMLGSIKNTFATMAKLHHKNIKSPHYNNLHINGLAQHELKHN